MKSCATSIETVDRRDESVREDRGDAFDSDAVAFTEETDPLCTESSLV